MTQNASIQLEARATARGFEILAINAGMARNLGLDFSAEVLKTSLPLWNAVPCMLDHAAPFANPSVRDLAGALHAPAWNETSQGIQANLVPGGPGAEALREIHKAALNDPAILSAVGFSAVLRVRTRPDGRVESIQSVSSVDCVIHPARGGRFLSSHPSDPSNPFNPGETTMNEIHHSSSAKPADPQPTTLNRGQTKSKIELPQNTVEGEIFQQVRLSACRGLLRISLQTSGLPEPSAERLANQFNARLEQGEIFEPAELSQAIRDEQALLGALTEAGLIHGPGRISGMVSGGDQLEAAVCDLFGVEREARLQAVKVAPLSGIRELYLMLTGDYDLHGGYYGERIQLATTADFTGLVKNALNKVVAQQWQSLGRAGYDWWERIVRVEHFTSLNSITGTLIGTVGALPVVEEGAEYTELAIGDSPETASFTKYGGYIPLTLELIDRDETRKLKAYASELGSAARRKISALVSAVFTSNAGVGPTMADGGALFNSDPVTSLGGHANLLTDGLAADKWDAVCQAVYNQPMLIKQTAGYYGSGPKMAVSPRYLVVPRALQLTAMKILYPSLENAATIYSENLQRGQPGDVIVNPDYVETDHWAAVVDPAIVPGIIVGERFGLLPEIFTASSELSPAVFMNDEHRIKVRMFTAVLVQDFRPLHKSNI